MATFVYHDHDKTTFFLDSGTGNRTQTCGDDEARATIRRSPSLSKQNLKPWVLPVEPIGLEQIIELCQDILHTRL